jgi:tRNA-2-methylthio-N6-dimethylallyladenosine synthase
MNSADSMQVSALLEQLGYIHTTAAEEADVIVLNTCVVRKSAEDKAIGRLTSLKAIKQQNPSLVINLMGCLVGMQPPDALKKQFPFVDVFSPPSDPDPLITYLSSQSQQLALTDKTQINEILNKEPEYQLPMSLQGQAVSVFIPIVYGCSHACSYCVIPIRRGREHSRPAKEILADIQQLADSGVREVTLLGQIVDRYGQDQPGMPNLSELLKQVNAIEGIKRIRFLTSHPLWMTDELLDTVANLPKLMPHFELPIQAGDDEVLLRMRRGYSVDRFMQIVQKIRQRFSQVSIATDIIVGFPGETPAQFENTLYLLKQFKPDMTHVARYSVRPDTPSSQHMADDVSADEKMRRFREIEQAQEIISTEINSHYPGTIVPVLFENKVKKRWRGRTPTNKLVFVETEEELRGQVKDVRIQWAGPWSMIATL